MAGKGGLRGLVHRHKSLGLRPLERLSVSWGQWQVSQNTISGHMSSSFCLKIEPGGEACVEAMAEFGDLRELRTWVARALLAEISPSRLLILWQFFFFAWSAGQ